MATNYRAKAEEMINPGLNAQIAAAKNSLNTSLNNLEMSKGGIGQNYANAETTAKQQGHIEKNNFSNSMLGRGMARSTIVGTGLAGVDLNTGNRINQLEGQKAMELNNIDAQKNVLNQNFGNTELSLRGDAEGKVLSLADQLQQRDEQLALQQKQQQMQEKQQQMEEQARQQQLALQQRQQNLSETNSKFDRDMRQNEYNYNIEQQKIAKQATQKQADDTEQVKRNMDQAMQYLEMYAGGKALDDNGNPVQRATRSDILGWITGNASELRKQGIDYKDLLTWAKSNFNWDKDSEGNWYKVTN